MGGLEGIAWLGVVLALGAGAPGASCPVSDSLPMVYARDQDRDGRYTGRDIEAALVQCSERGGCVLRLLGRTYEDVAILIYEGQHGACLPWATACLTLPFPNGLVIRGRGRSTVLRSPVWKAGQTPLPVLELWKRPDIPFRLESLVLDGRMPLQPGGDPPGRDGWRHYGFASSNWREALPRSQGCVRRVTVRSFFNRGILLSDAEGWVIENNLVEDIGCWEGVTASCPGLAGNPDVSGIPGYKTDGTGIKIGSFVRHLQLRENVIRRVSKNAIALKAGTDGMDPTIVNPRVESNRIGPTGSIGIMLAGVFGGRLAGNVIRETTRPDPPELATSYDTFGIRCDGHVEMTEITDTEVLDSAGIGLAYHCAGSGNRISNTLLSGSCQTKNPALCAPGTDDCYRHADLNISLTLRGAGSLVLDNVSIEDSLCEKSLNATGDPTQPFFLTIDEGHYPAGVSVDRDTRDLDLQIGGLGR